MPGFTVKPGRGIWNVAGTIILDRYASFDDEQKLALFILLANDMDVSCSDAAMALNLQKRSNSGQLWDANKIGACPTQLIRRLNQTQDATANLAMRHDHGYLITP